ncbi:Glycosyltransferase, GT2 family [Flavobacterium succinicans]|uniref:Glycosyltransferase, GT2 family n=1 Tax=Flavobacterium succinicans TaxID=29536 RepID=A0A1I4SGA2_9FLAO|nr:glycosyltransferase [Flavobacterium succinicans]SFM63538.1 Glycosyltransferase, GT2 family [Flavobacterium succinicans]
MKNFFLVIPTRDRIGFLSNLLLDLNAFASYISQVVIVDQSIEDYTINLEKLQLNYSYTLIKNDRSHSVNHSRNQALAFYKDEEWLFFLDDDLRIPWQAFEQIVDTVKPNVIDVLIPGIQFDGMKEQGFEYHTILDTIAKPHNFSKGRFRLQVCSGLNIVKREMFKEAGFYFDEHFTIWGDDWDYGMRLLQAGANIYFDPRILVEHLHAPSGGQRDKGKTLDVDLEKQKLYFYFYRKHFSKTVLKQQFYLRVIEGVKILFSSFNISQLKNTLKGYRMSKNEKMYI